LHEETYQCQLLLTLTDFTTTKLPVIKVNPHYINIGEQLYSLN
jgi:hypothetical protein